MTVSFLFLSFPLFAQRRVIDNAGLLTTGEILELEDRLAEIASTYNFDLVIVTETNIGSASPMDYADDYFDYNGYGLGKDRDGCLLLQVTETRDYWISTSGRGIDIYNAYAEEKMQSDVVKYLKANNPAEAYRAYIKNWKKLLSLDAKGKRYNFIHRYALFMYIAALLSSLSKGFATVGIMKKKMNTVHPKTEADSFTIPDSLVYSQRQDNFLYSTVTKTKISSSSSSSSGGSSSRSHTSSSGRSHGGGGGKY